MSTPEVTALPRRGASSLSERWARSLFLSRLEGIRYGRIRLEDPFSQEEYGDPKAQPVSVDIHQPRFYRDVVLGGSLGVAESYLSGDWDCDNLTRLFRIMIQNDEVAKRWNRGIARLQGWAQRLVHRWNANNRRGSRRNIAAHYDLGNEFFRLMLDDSLAYSSGIFRNCDSTLSQASLEKFDRVCRKLDLQPSDHLLEIGTGWGGFAIHAARKYGCRVTTTTISAQQHAIAKERIAAAGLDDRIQLLQQDYRDLTGRYDKLASIEMIEAVGHRYFDAFFGQCSRLLKPGGTCVLQAIVMPEQGYDAYLSSVDFIQRYVFPGGCLPTLGAMLSSVGRATDLRCVHVEEFGPHYARTLREWRERFHGHSAEVNRLGYDARFRRLWDYYLSYCEAAFDEHYTGVVQIQFDKPGCRRDPLQLTSAANRLLDSEGSGRQ
jgi:cyclopropane-fatty-acyl-phospholipid synthase